MIWFDEEVQCPQRPEGVIMRLTGTFNAPGSNLPMILLRLSIHTGPDDTAIIKTLFEKNPAILGAMEEPNPDDIAAKYYRQILKARDKISSTPYEELLKS